MHEWWPDTVRVQIGSRTVFNVNSNEQAAHLLMNEWPLKGDRYVRAMEAVLRSMEKPNDPGPRHAAFRDFEAAAREAGILVERH